jgi:exosortase A-associated hydrolase 1
MNYQETPVFFSCGEELLLSIIAMPDQPGPVGVLMLVGGPQYRVGSHRQYVLLSRYLAAQGIACMRFDFRGMGDSTGKPQSFEDVLPDTRAALDAFFARFPDFAGVVLWGLCDGASAASFYGSTDSRVTGLVLLNPWVRTEQTEAKTYMRHYYVQRLLQGSFWSKVLRGEFDAKAAFRSWSRMAVTAGRKQRAVKMRRSQLSFGPEFSTDKNGSLPERIALSLRNFTGDILIILSGNDYTAREFRDVTSASEIWKMIVAGSNVSVKHVPEADHTLSRREWSDMVATFTADWICQRLSQQQ